MPSPMTRRRQRSCFSDNLLEDIYGPSCEPSPINNLDIVHLWVLRCLVPLRAERRFVEPDEFSNDDIARSLGLDRWLDTPDADFVPKRVFAELGRLHRKAERNAKRAHVPEQLHNNTERLAHLLNLNPVEIRLLEFAVLLHNSHHLEKVSNWLGNLSSIETFRVLSVILDLPEHDVRIALAKRSPLQRTGLMSLETDTYALKHKLNLLSSGFASSMLAGEADPDELLRDKVSIAEPARLTLDDYPHLAPDLELLRPYLRQALAEASRGVNVLLHGPPGTGKSQLARVLAGDLGCDLFEVASEDGDGDPINGEARLQAMRAAQHFFAQRRSLVLFDETEDVFGGSVSVRSTAQSHKAWMNRMLEGNALPALWLTNDIGSIDPAYLRRFDMVIELPIPPKEQRERIVRTVCGDLVGEATIARIAAPEALAPAVVERAANVVRRIRDELDGERAAKALERLVDSTLSAQGHAPIRISEANRLPELYDPAFINADADLAAIADHLKQSRSARLCLFGPPGTGKTAYCRWLAEQLDMPLLVRRASDILAPYVGMNEKNVADAFRTAERDGAVLLIDEVDSFLRDRSDARHGWEATLVNEMLTQMESFPGVFVASTNLMSGLDQAALRRFDLKVKFDHLRPEQAAELLRHHCVRLDLAAPDGLEERVRRQLGLLTPGDFATVMRQQRFRPLAAFEDFFAALAAECAAKANSRPAIGFIR